MDEMKKSLIDSVYENDFSYMLDKNEVADDATSQVDEAELKVITRADRAKMLADIGKTRSGLKAKEKKGCEAAKDHDGDGKIESGTDEWKGSRDKAIKKRMASD